MHWEVFAGTICQLMLTAVVKHMVISYREPLCQMCNASRWRLWLVRRAADDPDCLSSPISLLLAQGQGLSDENRSSLLLSL